MTEPGVASSDATNISLSCRRDGDTLVLNGEKYWASGAGDPRCAVYIVMCKTADDDAPKHQRHSMVVVPAGTPGVEKVRPMTVFGHDDAPHGHMHLRFTDVRVPAKNMLLGPGRGFEIAQGRLGPGRIHHAMRAIGHAEKALELMCRRSLSREAFGRVLADLGANHDIIAEARIEIEMARLLCLKAAWMMDQGDARAAAPWISAIKVAAPRVALKVLRRGDADARRHRHLAGYALGAAMDPSAHPAAGRRSGRGAPPADRAGRVAKVHPVGVRPRPVGSRLAVPGLTRDPAPRGSCPCAGTLRRGEGAP